MPRWPAVTLKRSGFAREQECWRDKSEARIDGTKLSRDPLRLRHNQFGRGIRQVSLPQCGSVPVLDLDDHGAARTDNHNVDFVGLTTRIWMREVGQDEGSVLPFGTTKLLVDSLEGREFARIGKRTTRYMFNAQRQSPRFQY